jgi:hypothetical protein
MRKESVKDRLEQNYLYHFARRQGYFIAGSLPRQGDTTKWYDYSPVHNHGTITGATWSRLPSGLWVNSFDGMDDKIVVTVNTAASLTVMVWAKSPEATWSKSSFLISARVNNGFMINPTGGARTINGIVRDSAGNEDGVANTLTPDDITIYHLYTLTYDNSLPSSLFYVDTQVSANAPAAVDRTVGTAVVNISNDQGVWGFGKSIQGLIRIFNRALSAPEIVAIYQNERHLFNV